MPLGVTAAEVSLESLSPPRGVPARSVTTLAFRITNLGDTADAYDLVFDLSPEFSVLVMPEAPELVPGESLVFLVSLIASALASVGQHSVTLNAQSRAVPGDAASAVASVSVLPKAAVRLRLPPDGQGRPGGQVTYTLWVRNQGNDHDSFRLEVKTDWQWDLSREFVHLGPGASAEVTLTVTIPAEVKPGTSVVSWVTARSSTDQDVLDRGGVRTHVLPPSPDAVPVILFPTVPATVGWTGRLIDGEPSSDLSLTIGGTIAPGSYLALGGTLGFERDEASLKRGWIELRDDTWNVLLGSLSFTTPLGDIENPGVRFMYRSQRSPVRVTVCQHEAELYGHLRWGLPQGVLDLYARSTGGIPVLVTYRSGVGTLRLDLRDGGAVSFSTPGNPAVSGAFAWGARKTFSLAGIYRYLSSSFSYTLSEPYTRLSAGLGFAASLSEELRLAISAEWVVRQGDDPLSPLGIVDTKTRASLSGDGHVLPWTMTARLDTSQDVITELLTFTAALDTKLTVRVSPHCTLTLPSKVSREGTGMITSPIGLPLILPLPEDLVNVTDRWIAGYGITVSLPENLRFQLAWEVDAKRRHDPTSPLDIVDTQIRLAASGVGTPVGWSLGATFNSSWDQPVGLAGSGGANAVTIHGEVTIDFTPDLILVLESAVALPYADTLPLSFGASVSFRLRRADVSIKVSAGPDRIELAMEAQFLSPLPLIETLGRIEGVVFLDTNANGPRSPEAQGIEGVLLQIGDEQAITGPGGVFRFYPMSPGTYHLRILPVGETYCTRQRMPLEIDLSAGDVRRVEITVTPAATLSGRVIVYRAPNGMDPLDHAAPVQWVPDRPLDRARIIITNGLQTFAVHTTSMGEFFIPDLCPGTWEVRVELPLLVPPHHMEQDEYIVEASSGGHYELNIRVLPTPRIIQPLD